MFMVIKPKKEPTIIPRIRCPVCGMLCYLRNLNKEHSLDFYKVRFLGKVKGTGKGKGSGSGSSKGNIIWEKTDTIGRNTPGEFWIGQLAGTLSLLSTGEINPDKIPKELIDKLVAVAKVLGYEEPIIIKYKTKIKEVRIPTPVSNFYPHYALPNFNFTQRHSIDRPKLNIVEE